jgi:hypothetical protein
MEKYEWQTSWPIFNRPGILNLIRLGFLLWMWSMKRTNNSIKLKPTNRTRDPALG